VLRPQATLPAIDELTVAGAARGQDESCQHAAVAGDDLVGRVLPRPGPARAALATRAVGDDAPSTGGPMTEPRLAPTTDADWDDETRDLVEGLGRMNIFATLAHHPKLLKRWLVFGNHVLNKSTLPARERELAILRVGWRCGSDYEFGQHTVIGRREGITDEEIARLATESLDGWSATDATIVRAADELVAGHTLSDATWAALTTAWSTQQVMDLVFAVGQYVLTCMALNSFRVQREAGVPGFPS
jgi:alkylhydroperoxidase family enzyme